MRRLWPPKRRRLRRFEVLRLQLLLGLRQLLLQAWRRRARGRRRWHRLLLLSEEHGRPWPLLHPC